jgi:hypothetical protein
MHNEMCDDTNQSGAYELTHQFVARFLAKDPIERGFVFTLNQDQLVERFSVDLSILRPGILDVRDDADRPVAVLPHAVGVAHSTFHSARHTVKDRLRAARVPEHEGRAIMGHGATGVADSYGLGYPMSVLADAVARIK